MSRKLTLAEVVRKAGKAGGTARARNLSAEDKKRIAQMGAALGGKARANKLSSKRRRAIAQKAAKARWDNRPEHA